MPMITVRYVTPEPRPDLPEQIAALATRLAAIHLGKRPEVTAVLVDPAAPGSWFVAGQDLTQLGLITAGTNVKAETAAFIRPPLPACRTCSVRSMRKAMSSCRRWMGTPTATAGEPRALAGLKATQAGPKQYGRGVMTPP